METRLLPHHIPLYSKFKSWGFKPLVVDFYVQRVWTTFSLERILARVRQVRPEASGIVTLTLKPNFNFRNFKAGQHCLLTATVNGHRITRTYSPTLLSNGKLEFTIKRVEGGKVSPSLTQSLKRGDAVEISAPFGEMTWSQLPRSTDYVFCAGGVGITPLRSLIHFWAVNDDFNQTRSIDLHYWAKTADEHCFKSEFAEIAKANPRFKFHFYATQTNATQTNVPDISPNTSPRTSSKTSLMSAITPAKDAVVLACGPEAFVQAAEAVALANEQRFFGEHAHVAVASGLATLEAVDSPETFHEINYGGKVIRASSRKSILESLEEQGFEPAHGCRMGLCKSCTCLKKSGVTLSSKDQSTSTERNEEIQICVARPRSAIQIERY